MLHCSTCRCLVCVTVISLCLWTASGDTQRDLFAPATKVTFDLHQSHPIAEKLWGIFFEEIQHAGDGGIYAELVQDRQFGGLAYSLGVLHNDLTETVVPPAYYESDFLPMSNTVQRPTAEADENATGLRRWRQEHTLPEYSLKGQPRSWFPVGKASLTLVKQQPITGLGQTSSTAYIKINTGEEGGGLSNSGYWGIPVQKDEEFQLSIILQSESLDTSDEAPKVTVKLESEDQNTVYASADISDISAAWKHPKVMLKSSGTDSKAQLTLYIDGAAEVSVKMLSLFPAENVKGDVLQPFRPDLLQYLKDLKPRYVRMPGGCYVEGVSMQDAYLWKPSVGPIQDRPGHYNGPWHYWSTDGLGAFEYFQLAEALGAEPLWVINNGISHVYSVPAEQIWPMVQDALDLIEFVTGPVDTEWGSLRAKMGHPEPWEFNYFAIGNEDCGKPWYVENYIAFFAAIRARYPHMRLISNCDMDPHAPTDIFDWHMYTDSQNMFDRRHDFDNIPNIQDKQVFASEYAVFDDPAGHPIQFPGNLKAAIAEAGFMTGVERNSEHVAMAAFAPLLSHWNDRACPHNLVIFDNHRVFGTVSYYVQKLFSEFQGVRYIQSTVTTPEGDPRDHGIAASASCQDDQCSKVAFKFVNFGQDNQRVDVELLGLKSDLDTMTLTVLNGTYAQDENTFDDPYKITPHEHSLKFNGRASTVNLPPFSLSIISADLSGPHRPELSISQA